MMKTAMVLAAAAAALVMSAPASAVTFALGSTNSGPQSPTGFGALKYYNTFDTGVPAGLTGGSFRQGTNGTIYAAPFGDSSQYYAVGPDAGTSATILISAFDRVSFYWGSIDFYNTIDFLGAGGAVLQSFNGSQVIGGTPTGAESHTVTFKLDTAEAASVSGIRFSSPTNAFEFDNLAIGSSVPEPAIWLSMMLGVGLAGGTLRARHRRNRNRKAPRIIYA